MGDKFFRVIFRILLCLGIFYNASGQGEVVFKVHEDCRLHELCPLNCVRCDTVPQCYDMSDEFGCGHGIEVFHKLFPGPPVPPGMLLEKLKEMLWLEKVAYITEQLEKSSNNTVTSNKISFQTSTSSPASKTLHPVLDKSSYSDRSAGIISRSSPQESYNVPTDISQSHRNVYASSTTTPTFTRFNSRLIHSTHSQTDFKSNKPNLPSIYSSKAAISPLVNWSGQATPPERGNFGKETQSTPKVRSAVGVAVPLLPDPYPDPEPPANEERKVNHGFVSDDVTPPEIMPPIEISSQAGVTVKPIQYEEPTTTAIANPDLVQSKVTPNNGQTVVSNTVLTNQRKIVFRPEPLPTASATVSQSKVRTKQDSVVSTVNSIASMLPDSSGSSSNENFFKNIQEGPAPTISLSQVPMSSGFISNLLRNTVTNPQEAITNISNTETQSSEKNIYQDQGPGVQDQSLPSIPMMPGLIPQFPVSADMSQQRNQQTSVDYKVGDLYMALPVENKQQSGAPPETDKLELLIKGSDINQEVTTSQHTEGIPVAIIDGQMPALTGGGTWNSNEVQATNEKDLVSRKKTVTQQNDKNIDRSVNPQNMEFMQTPVEKKESTQTGIYHENWGYTQTAASTNAFDQTAPIDLLSLLFPGTQTPSSAGFVNEISNKVPDAMPDIVPVTENTPDVTSVSISTSKGDNDNGCNRVQDYTGFCDNRPHGYFKNNFDCASYIVCDWGRMHVCRCPQYTVFDANLGVCNWETEVQC